MNNINSKVYTDVSIIINMMPNEMQDKISKSFIKFIEDNKDINYSSNINPKIPLNKQNISKETKEMLGIIYKDYLCDTQKRTELLQQEQKELEKYEELLKKSYNLDNIFKKENHQSVSNMMILQNNSDIALVKHQESFFTRVKKFIFKILFNKST